MKAECNKVIDEQKSEKKQKIQNISKLWKFLDDKEPRANNSYLKSENN